ncbi:molybdopterin biosynthesis protein MoeB [bacterium]|nr:molybdopterin biosynthesis protein MoeB [bacterium]
MTAQDIERYARHIMLREIGGPGQARLAAAHVAIVGLGALGGPAALYLAAAGVGRMTLIDDDVVALSNLQRQVLFRTSEVGEAKTTAGARALRALNPGCLITEQATRLDAANARRLLQDAQIVLDGTDSFAARFAVNDACHALGVTLVSGAVGRWSAQLCVFRSGRGTRQAGEDRSPCYRCLVRDLPETEETCAAVGVAGPLAGMVGSRMALEAMKEITGAGDSFTGRLWVFDGLSGEGRDVALSADPDCPVCGGA